MSVMLIVPNAEYPPADERYRDEASGYVVVVETDGVNWGAFAPALPGVIAAGQTREEVRSLMTGAIELHLEGLRAEGEPIPPSDDV
jgi:predicted RNase H-like HicB family nuclease